MRLWIQIWIKLWPQDEVKLNNGSCCQHQMFPAQIRTELTRDNDHIIIVREGEFPERVWGFSQKQMWDFLEPSTYYARALNEEIS